MEQHDSTDEVQPKKHRKGEDQIDGDIFGRDRLAVGVDCRPVKVERSRDGVH